LYKDDNVITSVWLGKVKEGDSVYFKENSALRFAKHYNYNVIIVRGCENFWKLVGVLRSPQLKYWYLCIVLLSLKLYVIRVCDI
jgi:hypothetical protein